MCEFQIHENIGSIGHGNRGKQPPLKEGARSAWFNICLNLTQTTMQSRATSALFWRRFRDPDNRALLKKLESQRALVSFFTIVKSAAFNAFYFVCSLLFIYVTYTKAVISLPLEKFLQSGKCKSFMSLCHLINLQKLPLC